jgi:hypothetical protein
VATKKFYLLPVSALRSVQVKKKGSYFWDPHKRPKTLKKRPKTPKTPQNAPKTPQNAPKTPFFDLKTPVFFSSVPVQGQFFQVRSFQVSSCQVPDLIGRSGQFSSGESHLSSGRCISL